MFRLITFIGWMIVIILFYRLYISIIDSLFEWNPTYTAVRYKAPKFVTRVVSIVFKLDEDCEHMVGDLLEEYVKLRPELGIIKARLWLYRQSLNSILPIVWKALARHALLGLSRWFHRHGN